jgi:hypothetical protein
VGAMCLSPIADSRARHRRRLETPREAQPDRNGHRDTRRHDHGHAPVIDRSSLIVRVKPDSTIDRWLFTTGQIKTGSASRLPAWRNPPSQDRRFGRRSPRGAHQTG